MEAFGTGRRRRDSALWCAYREGGEGELEESHGSGKLFVV